jgi:hypothetical protein
VSIQVSLVLPVDEHLERAVLIMTLGKITINEEEFSINEVFRQGALNLADTLNLDELQAAQLFFASQDDTEELNLPLLDCAIIRFYQTQKYLLDCLRLVIQLSLKISDADPDVEFEKYTTEENTRLYLQATVHRKITRPTGRSTSKNACKE